MKKLTEEKNKTYIYGKHPVMDMISTEPKRISKIFIKKNFADEATIQKFATKNKIPLQTMEERKLDEYAEGGVHQGIVAQVAPARMIEMKDFFALVKDKENPCAIILDELEDPHNVGAIIRTAAALGASGIIMGKHRQAQINGTVYKTSAGTVDKIPLIRVANLNDAIRKLKENKFWVVGLDGNSPKTIWQEKFDSPTAFVIGAEGKGIRSETAKLCDFLLAIPMTPGVESLNASVSTALAIGEWKRQQIK